MAERMREKPEETVQLVEGTHEPPAFVQQAVPVDVQRSFADASAGLRELERQSENIKRLMQDPDFRQALIGISGATPATITEATFRALEEGHDAPSRYLRSMSDAARHSVEVRRQAERAMSPDVSRVRPAGSSNAFVRGLESVGRGAYEVFSRLGDAISWPFRQLSQALTDATTNDNQELNHGIRTWLGPAFLGEGLHRRFNLYPPVLTSEPNSFFDSLDRRDDSSSYGRYFTGTNHIAIRDDQPRESGIVMDDRTEARRMSAILHEQLHYASWLGGGQDIRWRDGEGQPVVRGYVTWLHEGLTELHAQQVMRGQGHEPAGVAYPLETTAGVYLQRLAGEDTLRSAYLSGDFTGVRTAVDARLGAGTFDSMMGMHNGTEALSYLMERIDAAGLGRSGWNQDPVVVLAGVFE